MSSFDGRLSEPVIDNCGDSMKIRIGWSLVKRWVSDNRERDDRVDFDNVKKSPDVDVLQR